jgi:hypothetical protein
MAVKSLILKLACFLAALMIWALVAGTTLVEADVGLPLEVAGLADGLTIEGSTLSDLVLVRLRASRLRLLAHQYLGRSIGSVRFDVTGLQPGPPLFPPLKDADVRAEADVLAILSPTRLRLQLDWQETRRLPVRVPLTGRLPADRLLGGPVVVRPDSLDVTGPRRFFADLDSLVTQPLDLAGLQRTLTRDLAVAPPPKPLQATAASVQVTVPVTQLTMRVLPNIPVRLRIEDDIGDVAVLPSFCDVTVRGPADSVAALAPGRLSVTVVVSDLTPDAHHVPGLVQHPDWVVSIQLEPANFMVIMGRAPVTEATR